MLDTTLLTWEAIRRSISIITEHLRSPGVFQLEPPVWADIPLGQVSHLTTWTITRAIATVALLRRFYIFVVQSRTPILHHIIHRTMATADITTIIITTIEKVANHPSMIPMVMMKMACMAVKLNTETHRNFVLVIPVLVRFT